MFRGNHLLLESLASAVDEFRARGMPLANLHAHFEGHGVLNTNSASQNTMRFKSLLKTHFYIISRKKKDSRINQVLWGTKTKQNPGAALCFGGE